MGYHYVVRIDGDGQHSIEEAARLLHIVRLGEVDIAIGSRFMPGAQTYKPPLSQDLGIRWFAKTVSLLTRETVSHPTSGMQAPNRRALITFAGHYPHDYPEVEARIWLRKLKLRVIEVPMHMAARCGSLSSITSIRAIYYTIKITLAIIMATIGRAPRRYLRERYM